MTAAERRAMRLRFLEDVVADRWDIAVDFQFEDVQFFEKNVHTRRKTDCCVMAHSTTIDLIRTDFGLNPRNEKYNMHMTVAEKGSDYLEVLYLHQKIIWRHCTSGKKLFGGTVPPEKKLFGGTVPPS